MKFCENCGDVIPIGTGSPFPNLCLRCYETVLDETDIDRYLWQALTELDGFDGVMLPEEFYKQIVRLYGNSRYSVEEITKWLDPESEYANE